MKRISLICLLIGFAQFLFATPKARHEKAQLLNNDESLLHEYFDTVDVKNENVKEESSKEVNFQNFIEAISSKRESFLNMIGIKKAGRLKRSILGDKPQAKSFIFPSIVFLFGLSTAMFFASWALQLESQKKVQTFAGIITLGCFLMLLMFNSETNPFFSAVDLDKPTEFFDYKSNDAQFLWSSNAVLDNEVIIRSRIE